jgi:hypothetical protein
MPALRQVAWFVLLAACEGPTLDVGARELPEFDAGDQDASDYDAAPDARPRDGQLSDGRSPDPGGCDEDEDCREPRYPHCHSKFRACVGCEFHRDCKSDEYCDTTWWPFQCRDDPGGHKDDPGPSTGGAP